MASEEKPKGYYSILGIANNSSTCTIRNAYRKLAMKWHPDKCNGVDQAGAKLKFQEIQEAYSVLSNTRKKALYDNGLHDLDDDDEDVEVKCDSSSPFSGLSDFISEMSGMMAEVQSSKGGKGNSFKELQQLFVDMFTTDVNMAAYDDSSSLPPTCMQFDKKRSWGGRQGTSLHDDMGTCKVDGRFNACDSHIFFSTTFDDARIDSNVTKKKKSTIQDSV